jgi:hypothetical protein
MYLIRSVSFQSQNIVNEFPIVEHLLDADVGLLAVVLALRGLSGGTGARELRIYLDGVDVAGATTNNVPANQPQGVFPETHGLAVTLLSLTLPALRAGQTLDVRAQSAIAGDTAASGTCELYGLDLLRPSEAAALLSELHLCKAALVNKQVQTIATGVVQIKDDDGATTLRTLTPSIDDPDAPTQNVITPT